MKNNFWQKIKRPILALAPMAGFNNSVFRQLAKQAGADIVYSQMASATAIFYNQNEANKTLKLIKKNRAEKNYVVQLFGAKPDHFALAAKIVSTKIKPAGLDINFGCPVAKVIKQGAGVDLMSKPKLARQIVQAVLANTNLPVSIKIRAGLGQIDAYQFIDQLKDLEIAALMMHGRTFAQGFSGPINYSLYLKIRKIFSGLILANGGINDLKTAKQVLKKTKADGLGLARGVLARPWLFQEIKDDQEIDLSQKQLFALINQHSKLVEKKFGPTGIIALRQHLSGYLQGQPRASYFRNKLVKAKTALEIKEILKL